MAVPLVSMAPPLPSASSVNMRRRRPELLAHAVLRWWELKQHTTNVSTVATAKSYSSTHIHQVQLLLVKIDLVHSDRRARLDDHA